MDRKEILERSRQENKNSDPVEQECILVANNRSFIIGLILCCILSVVNILVKGCMDYLLWVIYFGMCTTREMYLYYERKEKGDLILASLFFVLTLLFVIAYLAL